MKGTTKILAGRSFSKLSMADAILKMIWDKADDTNRLKRLNIVSMYRVFELIKNDEDRRFLVDIRRQSGRKVSERVGCLAAGKVRSK